ncbi:MAG: hypothetical protein RBT63_05380 [Bdellovibrionales bacterium]|nr:hypothetical protein [Bdellovibrionales bacterium]
MNNSSHVRNEIQSIIDRWKLKLEKQDESNCFVYGSVGSSDRILVLIWSNMMRINGAADYIDLYLQENDPELAGQLLTDIGLLIERLDTLEAYDFHD